MTSAELNPQFGTDLRDGFKVTNSWVNNGIVWLDDLQLFYRERAIIESDYAAKLSLLAKQYLEKKSAKSSVLSVGKTPTVTPGSLESASMTTWAIQLNAIEAQSNKHKEFAANIQTHIVDPLKALQVQHDSLRQAQVSYAKLLDEEKLATEEDVRKYKSKYDSVCQEVENRRKKADGDSKGKASAAFQQQLSEMHDAKNAYILNIAVANAQQERHFYEYLPEALDNLQNIAESRVHAVNQVWIQAAKLELETLAATSSLLEGNLSEIPRNNPRLDSLMFIEHNKANWQPPPEIQFEPSAVWHDDSSLATDERAKNFLRNTLSRSKGLRLEQRAQQARLKQEVAKAKALIHSAPKVPGNKEETEAIQVYFKIQEQLHESTRQLVSAETEIHTITTKVGDISLGARNHQFKPDTFKIPSNCDFCGDKIWGLSAKGMTCQDCGYTCHLKCEMKSPADCPGEQTKEEKKKLKHERQELLHSSAHQTLSDSSSVVASSLSANISQRSLAQPASLQRTSSTSLQAEKEAPPSRKVPPPPTGTKPVRRVLAPPPAAYVSESGGNAFEPVKGKVLYSYEATGPDQITIHENDEVVMIEQDDNSGWIKVRCNLSTGLVPKSYVSLNPPGPESSARSPPVSSRPLTHTAVRDSVSSTISSSSTGKKGPAVAPRRSGVGAKRGKYARALYSYEATGDAMHSITEGERLNLVNLNASPGWAEVEKDGAVKYVPRDYITEVD